MLLHPKSVYSSMTITCFRPKEAPLHFVWSSTLIYLSFVLIRLWEGNHAEERTSGTQGTSSYRYGGRCWVRGISWESFHPMCRRKSLQIFSLKLKSSLACWREGIFSTIRSLQVTADQPEGDLGPPRQPSWRRWSACDDRALARRYNSFTC